eukprot:7403956-Alexandrium_andersonii.AAC.1
MSRYLSSPGRGELRSASASADPRAWLRSGGVWAMDGWPVSRPTPQWVDSIDVHGRARWFMR